MLGALRSKKNNPIIVLLLGFVVLLMAGFGVTVSSFDSGQWAARVDGETVPYADYARAYAQAFRARQQRDRAYDLTRAESENLRGQVMDQIVGSKLLAGEARRRGLRVSDDALRASIYEIPAFEQEGRFDAETYERTLRSMGTNPISFEAELREELLANQLRSLLQGVGPSERELRARWLEEETKMRVKFVKIPSTRFEDQVGEASPSDVEAWTEEVEDPDAAISAFYKKKKARRYDVPKQVCARHILIKSPKQASSELRDQNRKKLTDVAEKLSSKTLSFQEAAKTYSDDSNKTKGGDLGCFGPGQMVPAFEKAAFSMKKDETSDVVETMFGFHLIQVYDVKEPIQRSLDDVKDEIRRELAQVGKANLLAKTFAERVLEAARKAGDLEKGVASVKEDVPAKASEGSPSKGASKDDASTPGEGSEATPGNDAGESTGASESNGFVVEETEAFNRTQQFIPKLGMAQGFVGKAFELSKENKFPDIPVEVEDGYVAFAFESLDTPKPSEFAEAKKMLAYPMVLEKQSTIYERLIEDLKSAADVEINPAAVTYDESVRQRVFRR